MRSTTITSDIDRRLDARRQLEVFVCIRSSISEEILVEHGITVSVSELGISIISPKVGLPLDALSIEVSLPLRHEKIHLTGRVVWDQFIEDKGQRMTGIAFDRSNSNALDKWKKIIANTGMPLENRRKRDRRTISQSADEKRNIDRRGHPAIYDKAAKFLTKRVKMLRRHDLYFYLRTLDSPSQTHIRVGGKEMIMFGSNNYLGLTTHPKVKEAALKAIEKFGVGAGAVRLLGGTLSLHRELEEKIAEFKGAEDAIAYSAGYTANLATISSIVSQPNDIAIIDSLDHASIIDGCRLANANMKIFDHNDMDDLEKKIKVITPGMNKIIIVDGVFSMDGDLAKLRDIYQIAKKYGAIIMVDEAHATGVVGETGRGTPEHFDLHGRIEVVMGTLSKALGGIGGFVAGSKTLVEFLRHSARAFVFSAALPPSVCASVLAAINVLETEPQWVSQLHKNAILMRSGLQSLGFSTGKSETAILPVVIRDELKTYEMTRGLHNEGIFVSPVAYPAVKKNASRLRVSVMATHTQNDLDKALNAFKKIGKNLGII